MKTLPQLLQQVKDDQWEKLEVVYCGLINLNIFGEMYCFVLPKGNKKCLHLQRVLVYASIRLQ